METYNRMNDFIKKQKELAREINADLYWEPGEIRPALYTFTPEQLDTLITQIITNTGEELMRLAEGERKNTDIGSEAESYLEYERRIYKSKIHNAAIDTIKQHITSVTGVE